MRTKKVGSTGRFGPRYGRRVRLRAKVVEESSRNKYICPECKGKNVTREAMGIWHCSKCNLKFAGGAYAPETEKIKTILTKELKEEEKSVEVKEEENAV